MAFIDRIKSDDLPKVAAMTGLWAGIAFTAFYVLAVWLGRPVFVDIEFLPDTGYLWYYWQLPEATFWSRFTAWAGFFAHNLSIWALIYYAQTRNLKTSKLLHPVNLLALGANALFVILHLLQTWFWYDGLAKDTPIWSSQYAVVVMLVMILMIENRRRGLFFGQKINWIEEPTRVLRTYHGYFFSWAVIYTFWYHPMEDTLGHLLGTFYTVLIMLQGSLFFTRAHFNKWWTTSLEVMVLIHGAMVAYLNFDGTWPFFLFGFATVFIVTQMHGLGLALWLRWGFVAAYALSAVGIYGYRGELERLVAIPGIALVEYSLVFIFALIIWGGMWVVARLTNTLRPQPT